MLIFFNPQHHFFTYVSNILYSFSLVQVVPSFSIVVPHSLHCHPLITLGCHLLLKGKLLQNPPALSHDVSGFTRMQIFLRVCELIQARNWNSPFYDDVDLSTEQWTKKFLKIMEECAPQMDPKRRRNLHWLTQSIL